MKEASVGLSIGEVARMTGLRTSALRYYEVIGLLPEPRRESGQRRYELDILDQIKFIRSAQSLGFSTNAIRALLGEPGSSLSFSERLLPLAYRKLAEVEKVIARAEMVKARLEKGLECRCRTAAECALFR